MVVTSDSTYFIMASSSMEKNYQPHPQLHNCLPNSHIFWYRPEQNSRRYRAHIFNPLHQRMFSKGSKYITYCEGQWYLLQQMKGNLFPHLGPITPQIAQYDLKLPDESYTYQETWEAARVPLIDSDQYKTEESTCNALTGVKARRWR